MIPHWKPLATLTLDEEADNLVPVAELQAWLETELAKQPSDIARRARLRLLAFDATNGFELGYLADG